MERSFLDVAKEPPSIQPIVAFANDLTATANNLTKSLFQFAYSYVFDDKEESALSGFSEMPIAPGFLDVNALVTTNAKISVQLQTGKSNVKKIKIYVRSNIESVYGDWYNTETFDKSILSIGDNTTFTYDFKNNISGTIADTKFATLLYDYVPPKANTQELINGNILAYGGITEGFTNGVTPIFTATTDQTVSTAGINDIQPIYNYWSSYTFVLVYFDDKKRTNGVSATARITTGSYNETVNINRILLSISSRPPIWATSFLIGRSKNGSIDKFLFWISESTYKDDKFAYIGIQNLYTKTPGDKTISILTYDFVPGDRIRLISRGTTSVYRDFAIEALVNSPEIAYIQRTGFFVKIKLPTTDTIMDFGLAGYGSYLIELYTPASQTSEKLTPYYEFGETYSIGNAGLTNRYHNGGTQNQASDLSVPATFAFTKGDVYMKTRTVKQGSGGEYKVDSGDAWTSSMLIGNKITSSNIGNENFILGSTNFIEASSYPDGDSHWLLRTQGTPYTFNLNGAIKINATSTTTYKVYLFYYISSTYFEVAVIPNRTLTVGDNTIPFSITFAAPVNTRFFLATDNSNSQALHYYDTAFTLTTATLITKKVPDANFSDSFLSAVNSNGRPFVIDEGLVETYKDIIRFSEAYQPDTNINKTNRFYDLNYVECDRSKGVIQRLKARGDMLKAYQYRGVLPFGIYKHLLSNSDGSSNLIQSERLLNRIKYYDGDYGIGNQPCSLASSSGAEYFTDPVRGYQIRLAGDGMTPISELYKAQFYLPPIVSTYLKSYTTDSGSQSKIIATYDFLNEEFISIFQKQKTGSTVNYPGDALGFSEQRNGYSSSYDYYVESILCAETTMISWKGGAIFIHDSNTRNTFHGTYYPSRIDIVINGNEKKEFLGIGYHANSEWTCPNITTETGAVSNLLTGELTKTEGVFTAAFGRDINSIGGFSEGDFLKGVHMQIRLENNSTALAFITGIYLNILNSPKNY
jgi:hypothetical protein